MKKTTLKWGDRTQVWRKDDDFLPQEKCVPDHDDRFIHHCRVRLCEDNQVYILLSILPAHQYKKTLRSFQTHIHSCWTHEKKKEKIVLLRFGFIGEERKKKCLLYHPVEEKNIISWRQDHSLERPVLKTFVASMESPYICLSSTLRTRTRRTI